MLKIAIYPSDHGFGHAARMAALAQELIDLGIQVRIRSTRPDFLYSCLDSPFCGKDEIRNDIGVLHQEGLVADLVATKETLLRLMSSRSMIVEREVSWLRRESIDFVIADIPYLIIEACSYAGIPVFAISNFDWSFIYQGLFSDDAALRPLLNTIRNLYQRCDDSFRLPFSSRLSMSSFRSQHKTGLLARRKIIYRDIRSSYSIDPDTRILACTFGGEPGMSIDLKAVCSAFPGVVISSNSEFDAINHVYVPRETDWLDVIHGSDILLTKPGYSTFAEAAQFNLPILYRPRRDYPEEDILVKGLRSYKPKYEIPASVSGIRGWKKIFAGVSASNEKTTAFRNQNTQIALKILGSYFSILKRNHKLKTVMDIGSNNLNYLLWNSSAGRVVHTAHFTTKLGNRIDQSSIKRFKNSCAGIMDMDALVSSDKKAIAASVARENPKFEPIALWLRHKYDIKTRILSQKLEARLAYRACINSLNLGKDPIIADIGGLSTELIWGEDASQWKGIKLGLLSLSQLLADYEAETQVNPFPDVPDAAEKQLVLVGLTGSFLAAIVNRQNSALPWQFHNTRIYKKQLEWLAEAIQNQDYDSLETYMQSSSDLTILKASCWLVSLLLDKYKASDILVCYYGISFGYALQ